MIANSSFLLNEAIKAGYDKKIDLIAYFTNSTSDIKSYENDFPKITFIGRLSETKGIRYLLESLLIIIKKNP